MGLKEWLSLDFSKRADATDPPSPPPPSRKASNARPPRPYPQHAQAPPPPSSVASRQRRPSDARGSYSYQTPRQHQRQQTEPFSEHSVGHYNDSNGNQQQHQQQHQPPPPRHSRLSNASSSQYQRASIPSHHHQQQQQYGRSDYNGGANGRRAYQSESGYYFEENGVDDVDRSSAIGRQSNQYEQEPPRPSLTPTRPARLNVRYADQQGEPIIVKGLQRTNSLRMAPQTTEQVAHQVHARVPSMRRMSTSGYAKERRSSLMGDNNNQSPPAKEHQQKPEEQQRSSVFDALRFSWLGIGRSSDAADNRFSQLATETPRRSSVVRPVNEDAEIVMQGWLDKCGQQFKTWKWRFFVLRADGVLAYYADEHMKRYKGSINVGYGSKADISMQSNLIEKKNVFMIATGSRNMMISTPSQKMLTKWIAKLHAAGATPPEPWDPSKKTVNFFVRDTECPHEWKRYDDPTSYIHMEGCLMKRGHLNKNWKNRFFRIERGELRYYTEGQEQLKGSMDLKGTIVSPGMTQSPDGLKNYFVLTSKDGKFEMHLSAPNEQTMHRWIEALQEAQTALSGKGAKGTVSGLALVVKHAEEIPLAKEEVVYEAPELINVELERRMESLIVVSCRAGTVPVGSQLITVGGRSILRESYAAARHALRAAICPLKLHFLVPPYKRGELIKKSRSGFENWKRRVVILTNGELQYFKEVASSSDTKTLKHRKTFPLYGCYLNLIQMPGREFCIIVARSPTDKLVLEARDEEERIEWASVIYCSIRMVSQGVTPGHIENLQLEVARDPSALLASDIDGSFKQDAPLTY